MKNLSKTWKVRKINSFTSGKRTAIYNTKYPKIGFVRAKFLVEMWYIYQIDKNGTGVHIATYSSMEGNIRVIEDNKDIPNGALLGIVEIINNKDAFDEFVYGIDN